MLQYCEIYIKDIIKGKRTGFFALFLKAILRLMSWGFRLGVFCRNWAFDRRLLRKYIPPVPMVISIGNIVAGGTGKTPVTQLIAKQFYKDYSIALVSRGYRSTAEKLCEPLTLSKGEGPIFPPVFCGDEPFLLSQSLPEAFFFVGRDRHKAALMAARAGSQIILIDDGMQHRYLARDLEVVVINAYDPFGKGDFLPRGYLRDTPFSLSRAHLVVINHVTDEEHFNTIKASLRKYTDAPCIGTSLIPSGYYNLQGDSITCIKNKRVGIFCGLGYPEQFRNLMSKHEISIVDEYFIPDHISPSHEDLLKFANKCLKDGAEALLCTEKDKVKLVDDWKGPLPIWWTKGDLHIVSGKDNWDSFIQGIKEKLSAC